MLVLLGVSHGSAPLEIRERLAVAEAQLPETLARLTAQDEVEEAMILSTCNRVEVLARTRGSRTGLQALKTFLARERNVSPEDIERYSYHFLGREAARHLLEVCCGLDSMILGEPQITGQVKQAYLRAKEAGTTGTIVERLSQQALATAKRVRTETDISRHPVSIAFAAVTLARQIFGELAGRSALLLGAGKMAALVATHLATQGVAEVNVASRTYNRAVTLARRFDGQGVRWESATDLMGDVDIVVSGTAAPDLILTRDMVQQALKARRSRPLFLIDIAVPRDVDPAVNELDNVYLYDVDDLQGVVHSNLEERQRAAETARLMVSEEVASFERWVQSLDVAPTIVSLREAMLRVGDEEVSRFRAKLGPLTAQQEEAVQLLTRSIIQKLLHRPIRHLKGSVARGDTAATAELFRELFGIERASPPAQRRGDGDSDKERPATGPQHLVKGGRED